MISRYQDNCKNCTHYLQNKQCKAFPEGIPEVLWSGDNLHRTPYEGDNGVLYSPKPTPTLEFLWSLMK